MAQLIHFWPYLVLHVHGKPIRSQHVAFIGSWCLHMMHIVHRKMLKQDNRSAWKIGVKVRNPHTHSSCTMESTCISGICTITPRGKLCHVQAVTVRAYRILIFLPIAMWTMQVGFQYISKTWCLRKECTLRWQMPFKWTISWYTTNRPFAAMAIDQCHEPILWSRVMVEHLDWNWTLVPSYDRW